MAAEVLRGIESVTDSHGYQTMLAHYGYSAEREELRLMSLLSYNIDGLILSDRTHTERTLKMIEVSGIPVVEIMDSTSPCIDLAVGFNNHDAAYQMTKTILQHGHSHPVYLGARLDERTIIRMQGYEQAMREFNLEPRSICTDRSSSYSLGESFLKKQDAATLTLTAYSAPTMILPSALPLSASGRDYVFLKISPLPVSTAMISGSLWNLS